MSFRNISMCCGSPLVSTMVFDGAEMYCMHCKSSYGMFDAPEQCRVTDTLLTKKDTMTKIFRVIMKDYIPHSARRIDCDKCKTDRYHIMHATPEQLERSKAAIEALREWSPTQPTTASKQ